MRAADLSDNGGVRDAVPGRARPFKPRSAQGNVLVSPAVSGLVLAMFAVVLGCSNTGGGTPPVDAAAACSWSADAAADRRSPKEARSEDARSRDARSRDARSRDARPGDAIAVDVASADATPEDAGAGEAGTRDASSEDARDSGTDAALSATVSLSAPGLQPAFSAGIHDYYVRCTSGENTFTVSMTAPPGSTIALLQPISTPPSTSDTATLTVLENEAIVIGVTADGGSDSYWIRCLPHDFPALRLTLHPEAGAPTPGYYLLGNVNMAPNGRAYAFAVDGNGVPVWYQATANGGGPSDVDNVLPATISYDCGGGEFTLLDLVAGTTSYVEPSGVPLDLHELRYLPNGDYLMIADPVRTGVDLTGLGTFGANEDIMGCVIQEVDPTGAKVWQWDAWDHFDPVKDTRFPTLAGTRNGVQVVDVFHCNSIDVDEDGDLLVSARHMDSVFMISKASGAILWKMGGATYTKDGAPYIAVANDPLTSFYRQHDARLLPGCQLSMFDDQTGKPGPARAVIYSYDLVALKATVVWEYRGAGSSAKMGSFRILEDGSRVVGWGMGSDPSRAFTELDANGNDVLDFGTPGGTASYRATKIPTTAFDIEVLRSATAAL